MSSPSVAKPLRVVAYFRRSSDRQEDSVPQQRTWAAEQARADNLVVVETFADEGITGHYDERPGLLAMLEFCKAEGLKGTPIDGVLAWKPDRLSRADSHASAWFYWELRKAGLWCLVCSDRLYDFEVDSDRLLLGVGQDFTANKFSKDLADNATRGKLDRARQGKPTGGRTPYGYRTRWLARDGAKPTPDRYVIDREAADVVRFIFEAYASGRLSLRGIVQELTARDVRTPSQRLKALNQCGGPVGELWNVPTVRRILTSEVYLGSMVWNRTHQGRFLGVVDMKVTPMSGKGRKRSRDPRRPFGTVNNPPEQYIVRPGTHDAIVDRDLFDQANRRLRRAAAHKGDSRTGQVYPLAQLLVCGDCEDRQSHPHRLHMYGRMAGDTAAYICSRYSRHGKKACNSNTVREAPLLRAILRKIRQRFTPELIEELRALCLSQGDAPPDVERLTRAADDADRVAQAAIRRLAVEEDDAIALVMRGEVKRLMEEARRARQAAESARQAADDPARQPDALANAVAAVMADLDRLAEAPPVELRAMLRDHIDRVVLHFKHSPVAGRSVSEFVRGEIWLREDSPLGSILSPSSCLP